MEKKKRFKMPHAYVIIFIMTVITAILANIIPAGTFNRVEDASGNSVVVADSFHQLHDFLFPAVRVHHARGYYGLAAKLTVWHRLFPPSA